MKILVTAGNTMVPIDQVRAITNVFSGRTGADLALHAQNRGHDVTLLSSHPEVVAPLQREGQSLEERWSCQKYRTFDDLRQQMAQLIPNNNLDVIIHCAAVSDYQSAGVHAPDEATKFDPKKLQWTTSSGKPPQMVDRAAGKVKSNEPELWIRLVRTPKLVDLIRTEWDFRGLLVKFKLEVGITEEELLEIAERSRQHSNADLMVANTLEGASTWAYVGPLENGYERVSRRLLSERVLSVLEQLHSQA